MSVSNSPVLGGGARFLACDRYARALGGFVPTCMAALSFKMLGARRTTRLQFMGQKHKVEMTIGVHHGHCTSQARRTSCSLALFPTLARSPGLYMQFCVMVRPASLLCLFDWGCSYSSSSQNKKPRVPFPEPRCDGTKYYMPLLQVNPCLGKCTL